MKKIFIELSEIEKKRIKIGYEGEQNHTQVIIRCGAFFAKYPDATAYMTVQTQTNLIYPVELEKDGSDLIWDVSPSDVSIVGTGKLQLTFTDGSGDGAEIIKSAHGSYDVLDSLDPNGDAPDPIQHWIDKAEQTARQIAEESAIYAKEEIVESYGEIAPAIIETASGAIASFSDGADGMLVKTLEVQIDPVQEGSGDPSPENVRPISGWDSANVSRTGKNLLNLVESEMITIGWDRAFPISIKEGTYIISCQNQFGVDSAFGARVSLTDENNVVIKYLTSSYNFGNTEYSGSSIAITEEEASRIKRINFALRAWNTPYADIVRGNLQLELGSTATTYKPYSGTTAEYEFPQSAGTVYGGTLTIHQDGTGELVVKRWYKKVTWGEGGQATSPTDGFIRKRYEMGISNKYPSTIPQICSVAPYTAAFNQFNLHFYVNDDSNAFVFLPENTPSDLEIEISGELATPVTYQLTNQQVLTLLKGNNVVFADCGSVSIEYPADTKLYIDGKVAELQALILENISNS